MGVGDEREREGVCSLRKDRGVKKRKGRKIKGKIER